MDVNFVFFLEWIMLGFLCWSRRVCEYWFVCLWMCVYEVVRGGRGVSYYVYGILDGSRYFDIGNVKKGDFLGLRVKYCGGKW